MKKYIIFAIIFLLAGIGSFFLGKSYEYNMVDSALKNYTVNLAGLELNSDNKYVTTTFTCYPLRNDGNCSNQIIENYQKLDNLAVSNCNDQLKNNVRYIQPLIRPRSTITNTDCYTDAIGGFHCNSFGF